MKKYLTYILIVLAIFFIGCSNTNTENEETNLNVSNSEENQLKENEINNTIEVENSYIIDSNLEFLDCEENFSCFVEASKNCVNSKVNYNVELNFFGTVFRYNYDYEIKKNASGICFLNFVINDIHLDLPAELINSIINETGLSEEEAIEELTMSNEAMVEVIEGLIGTNASCSVDSEYLYEILSRWEQDLISTSDWDEMDCSGTFFELNNY